jgi:hypothetical protein
MDFNAISIVEFGNVDSLQGFLWENAIEHQLFRDTFLAQGIEVPAFPIAEANTDNLDDWLLAHQVEHQAFAQLLNLDNPFNMLDVDWNVEDDFYDWIASHLYIHEQIAAALSLQ